MSNNDSITLVSVEKHEEKIIDAHENLERHRECCIYRVPKTLRKINEEAYTPKVISIGPLHHGKAELADMEKHKIRYKRELGKRIGPEKLQECIKFIEENELLIRNYYAERSELQKLEFVTMIFYDAVFIIELFLRQFDLVRYRKRDFLLDIALVRLDIISDLQLLENQLPFFVLEGLYRLAFSSNNGEHTSPSFSSNNGAHTSPSFSSNNGEHTSPYIPSFLHLSCEFFRSYLLLSFKEAPAEMEVKHFTDLGRSLLTRNAKPESRERHRHFGDLPCAVKLQESGLKFKGTDGESLIDIRFEEERRSRIPWQLGVDHELQIPRIGVDDQTESLTRNLMALEQCHYPGDTIVCNYVDLMDRLIETVEDVNLLSEARIISNNLGDSARIATMFNNLGQEICLSDSHYCNIFDELKAHYENRWRRARATLKRVYFNNPWRGTATVAAVVLLVLTVIQTICSIQSSVK